jgi:hypothetical protein
MCHETGRHVGVCQAPLQGEVPAVTRIAVPSELQACSVAVVWVPRLAQCFYTRARLQTRQQQVLLAIVSRCVAMRDLVFAVCSQVAAPRMLTCALHLLHSVLFRGICVAYTSTFVTQAPLLALGGVWDKVLTWRA